MNIPVELPPSKIVESGYQQQLQQRLRQLAVREGPSSVAQDYTFQDNDTIDSLQVDATAGNVTITLPSPTGNRRRRVIKTDSSANTVVVSGTINGVTNYTLNKQYEQLTVEPTQVAWLIVGTGTLTPSFNSISFPATQVASSDPNTLDDYEEGTWTPSLGGNATYTTQTGTYTKIGRVVTVFGRLTVNVLGTGSTSLISGLPFAPSTFQPLSVGYYISLSVAVYFLSGYVTPSQTVIFTGTTGAQASITNQIVIFQNSADVMFSSTFYT